MELTRSPARVREARFTSGLHSQVSRRRRKSGLPVSRDDPSRPLRPYTPWYTSSLPGALRAGDSPARARKRGAHGRAAGPGAALGCDTARLTGLSRPASPQGLAHRACRGAANVGVRIPPNRLQRLSHVSPLSDRRAPQGAGPGPTERLRAPPVCPDAAALRVPCPGGCGLAARALHSQAGRGEASVRPQQRPGVFRPQRQGRHCPAGRPVPGSPSRSSCPRPRCPGTFRIPPRPVPQREEERRLKLPVRGGGHGPGAVTFAGRGLCLPLPSGKPWGGGWSAHWIAVTWSRRSGTGEAGDPTPTPGSKGTGRGCCHQERGGRAGLTQSGLSAHPQRSVSASPGVWALAAHFPGPLTHWASDPPKGRGRGPLRPGQCGSPGRRSGRLGLASGWEYVLSSLLRPVSDHSLCSGDPGRRTDQGHSSDSVQKLQGPRRPVGARDGILVVALGHAFHLITLEGLGSLSC